MSDTQPNTQHKSPTQIHIELPILVQKCIYKYWNEISDPSPSPNHSVILRDKHNQQIRKIQVRNENDKIEYEKVQKRFYIKTNETVYEDWKIACHKLISDELLSKNKKVPTKGTFVKWKPHYIHQIDSCVLKQMLCDTCTEFVWWYEAMIKFLLKTHNCGKKTCNNYRNEMGNECSCVDCTNCVIFRFKELDAYDLLDELLCASYSTFLFLSCANAHCANTDCNIGKFKQLLYNGTGCHTFDGQSSADVVFKMIEKISNETDDKKKSHQSCSHHSESYNAFRKTFIDALQMHLFHQFIKRK